MLKKMSYILPGRNVSISLIMEITVRCIGGASLEEIEKYTGLSKPYIRTGLCAAKELGLILETLPGTFSSSPGLSLLLNKSSNDDQKMNVFRSFLQKYDPFILFLTFLFSNLSSKEAIRKTTSYSTFNIPNETIESLFLCWGKQCGLISQDGKPEISFFNPIEEIDNNSVTASSDQDASTRLYLIECLTPEVFSWLDRDEVDELNSSLKTFKTDPRNSIECSGRALEDVLRKFAFETNLDPTQQQGISQLSNYIFSQNSSANESRLNFSSKLKNIGLAAGDIRNMAGHSKEAKTHERWTISSTAALGYCHIVFALIRSLFLTAKKCSNNF